MAIARGIGVRRAARRSQAVLAACVLLLAGACEDEVVSVDRGMGGGAPAAAAAAPAAAGAAATPTADDMLSFKDEDFVESEQNRDPFRSYSTAFQGAASEDANVNPQRPVIMPTTAVESMRLLAIISGLSRPKAMLTDSLGVGYVVERGDYIGRGKVVQSSGNVAMTLNWRVDRIRENEVVLTRADPTDPNRPPLSRIINMRDNPVQ